MDRAGKKYWDDAWADAVLPSAWNPRKEGLNSYVQKEFHEYFRQVFHHLEPIPGKKLLEIGCAKSASLPYFAKEYGFEVSGIDYSEVGCNMARAILEREGIKGDIFCEDFFSPSDKLIGQFDVVVSFGVAEHFQDTARCIYAFSRFLKQGGIIITNIPNMVGVVGSIQKAINRPIFDIHVPLDRETLQHVHKTAGLDILHCDYFMSTNFGVCNLNNIPQNSAAWWLKKIILAVLVRMSMSAWWFEKLFGGFPVSRAFSPYINCVAKSKDHNFDHDKG